MTHGLRELCCNSAHQLRLPWLLQKAPYIWHCPPVAVCHSFLLQALGELHRALPQMVAAVLLQQLQHPLAHCLGLPCLQVGRHSTTRSRELRPAELAGVSAVQNWKG